MTTSRDTEERLRRALAARADRVEPAADDLAAISGRINDVRRSLRRRRTVVSAAAVLLVGTVVGGLAVVDSDDNGGRTEVATGRQPTPTVSNDTTGATEPSSPDGPAGAWELATIWPLPTMSLSYDDPTQAAMAFVQTYLGIEGPLCPREPVVEDDTTIVPVVKDGVCAATGAGEPFGPTTEVRLVRKDLTWAVLGATSNTFTASLGATEFDVPPAEGLPIPLSAIVTAATDIAPLSVELRDLGSLEPLGFGSSPPLAAGERTQIPITVSYEGVRVLVVSDRTTAVATLVDGDPSD